MFYQVYSLIILLEISTTLVVIQCEHVVDRTGPKELEEHDDLKGDSEVQNKVYTPPSFNNRNVFKELKGNSPHRSKRQSLDKAQVPVIVGIVPFIIGLLAICVIITGAVGIIVHTYNANKKPTSRTIYAT